MADVLEFFKGQRVASYGPGDVVINEGGQRGQLYALISGEVDVIREDTQVTHVDEPGSIFGEMGVLLDLPHSATVKALSAVEVHVVDEGLAFIEANPELALHLATLLARRLYYTTSYLVDLQQQSAGRRVDLDAVDVILSRLYQPEAAPKRPRLGKA
jgi:CRP-like cAMP-binding protein